MISLRRRSREEETEGELKCVELSPSREIRTVAANNKASSYMESWI